MSSSSFCGLRLKTSSRDKALHRKANSLLHFAAEHAITPTTATFFDPDNDYSRRSADFEWAREDQLSVILEVLDAETRRTPGNELDELTWSHPPPRVPKFKPHTLQKVKEVAEEKERDRERDQERQNNQVLSLQHHHNQLRQNRTDTPIIQIGKPPTAKSAKQKLITQSGERPVLLRRKATGLGLNMEYRGDSSTRPGKTRERRNSFDASMPVTPASSRGRDVVTPVHMPMPIRAIEPPPRDLETLTRIDNSLVFEQFTTSDAWALGCALRTRLVPLGTPAVIDISLVNQNQVLFHTSTHPGVVPDSDSWVARKRNTVLRWGVSSWYMSCKFAGDEYAFASKYALGDNVGRYAISGGGVPIRVRGVEGVVAVVVVNGLKQDENHAVIVECIRELYY